MVVKIVEQESQPTCLAHLRDVHARGGDRRRVAQSALVCRRPRRQLFEPFGKSSAQAAETAPGIGLGLGLARRLVHDLGGDLQCDQLGQAGLAFRLTLPGFR